ncbi:MAG: DUF429 domain-containing protein [Deltaproteobacteria bacterium]|nr:DUF429 domain-containing protein [Deltaproteobacteria bacterium]
MSTHPARERNEVDRYLGLSLGGAKSDHTCLTVIDHYRRQDKAFVVDVFEGIGPQKSGPQGHRHEITADQVILELVGEHQPGIRVLAVDAPLTLPPCLPSCEPSCEGYERCKQPTVRWMRSQYRKAKETHPKLKHFTPYSQRPVDLYFRYRHPQDDVFQDETMGANLAPRAVRMQYLKGHLKDIGLIEVWPKLALFYLQKPLGMNRRDFLNYRDLDKGVHVRERILESVVERSRVFIYDRDHRKYIHSMPAFDSFVCAWVALQYGCGRAMKFRGDVPVDSGWVQIPEL